MERQAWSCVDIQTKGMYVRGQIIWFVTTIWLSGTKTLSGKGLVIWMKFSHIIHKQLEMDNFNLQLKPFMVEKWVIYQSLNSEFIKCK